MIDEHWDPKIIGEVNDMYVKLAKIKGAFEFHTHQDEDELRPLTEEELKMKKYLKIFLLIVLVIGFVFFFLVR